MPEETWGSWFRSNFDKILLFLAWLITLAYCAYLIAFKDASDVSWGREMAGTVLGAFLGLVTGSRLAAHAGAGATTTVEETKLSEPVK